MGVALFSIVSGEITKMIMQANNPPPPDVFGKRVGVPRLRQYERSYVVLNGGKNDTMTNTTNKNNRFSKMCTYYK